MEQNSPSTAFDVFQEFDELDMQFFLCELSKIIIFLLVAGGAAICKRRYWQDWLKPLAELNLPLFAGACKSGSNHWPSELPKMC